MKNPPGLATGMPSVRVAERYLLVSRESEPDDARTGGTGIAPSGSNGPRVHGGDGIRNSLGAYKRHQPLSRVGRANDWLLLCRMVGSL